MTTPALNETAPVRDLLFGGMALEPTDALAESLRELGTVNTLVTGFRGLTAVVEREVATEASGLLSLNLLDLAVAGWKRYGALTKAARRTAWPAWPGCLRWPAVAVCPRGPCRRNRSRSCRPPGRATLFGTTP